MREGDFDADQSQEGAIPDDRVVPRRAQRETIRMLKSVDAATLRDLGIADIESQVYGDPADRMRAYAVSTRVNSAYNDEAALIEPAA